MVIEREREREISRIQYKHNILLQCNNPFGIIEQHIFQRPST